MVIQRIRIIIYNALYNFVDLGCIVFLNDILITAQNISYLWVLGRAWLSWKILFVLLYYIHTIILKIKKWTASPTYPVYWQLKDKRCKNDITHQNIWLLRKKHWKHSYIRAFGTKVCKIVRNEYYEHNEYYILYYNQTYSVNVFSIIYTFHPNTMCKMHGGISNILFFVLYTLNVMLYIFCGPCICTSG